MRSSDRLAQQPHSSVALAASRRRHPQQWLARSHYTGYDKGIPVVARVALPAERDMCDAMRSVHFGFRTCEYAPFGQHFSDRATKTKLPGVVAPWQIGPQATAASADPFDSLSIEMPFRSLNLLQYFVQTKALVAGIIAPREWRNSLAFAKYDPVACRSILLVAGLHFAGSAGGLQSFEATYLHHKLQCIQVVNKWLSNPEMRATVRCMKLIGTLCLSEACLENLAAAESHLAGLMTLLELRAESCKTHGRDKENDDNEILERYILLTQSLVVTVKGRSARASSEQVGLAGPFQKEHEDPIGHKDRLDALRLTPYFFGGATKIKARPIDASPTIAGLKVMTSVLNQPIRATSGIPPKAWSPGGLASMILTYSRLHAESLSDSKDAESDAPEKLMSSWGGLAAASSFYLCGVLGLTKTGMPIESHLLSHVFVMLRKDLDSNVTALRDGKCNSDFWLWKAFSAAFAIAKLQGTVTEAYNPQVIGQTKNMAYHQVRVWSKAMKVSEWETAKEALHRIIWAEICPEEEMKIAWEAATKGESRQIP